MALDLVQVENLMEVLLTVVQKLQYECQFLSDQSQPFGFLIHKLCLRDLLTQFLARFHVTILGT